MSHVRTSLDRYFLVFFRCRFTLVAHQVSQQVIKVVVVAAQAAECDLERVQWFTKRKKIVACLALFTKKYISFIDDLFMWRCMPQVMHGSGCN